MHTKHLIFLEFAQYINLTLTKLFETKSFNIQTPTNCFQGQQNSMSAPTDIYLRPSSPSTPLTNPWPPTVSISPNWFIQGHWHSLSAPTDFIQGHLPLHRPQLISSKDIDDLKDSNTFLSKLIAPTPTLTLTKTTRSLMLL